MKKFFLFLGILVFLSVQSGYAQLEKGTLLLGGSGSFQKYKGISNLTLNPNIGLFLANKFVLGLNASYINSSSNTTLVGLGPYARGYFLSGAKGSLFASAGFNYFNIKFSNTSESESGYSIGLGYAHFLNKSVAMELSGVYYKNGLSNSNNTLRSPTSIFGINIGFQIHFNKSTE